MRYKFVTILNTKKVNLNMDSFYALTNSMKNYYLLVFVAEIFDLLVWWVIVDSLYWKRFENNFV